MNLSIRLTGWLGLAAALLVGAGEFLLHFDPLARFSEGYAFMADISDERLTVGHFFAMIGIPFYFLGCWHIYQMLKPANKTLAAIAFLIAAFGFMMGAVWLGSRASIASLQHYPELIAQTNLVALYETRYETLLQVVRITTLILSVIYVFLVLKGGSRYPRWMAALNPFVLIVASFLVYAIAPSIGKFLMPIALNVAFAIFFSCSLWFGDTAEPTESSSGSGANRL